MVQNSVNKSALINSLSNVGTQLFGLLYFIMYKPIGLLPWHFKYSKLFQWNPAIAHYNYGFSSSFLGTYYNIIFGIGIAILNYYYMVHFPEIMPKKIGLMVVKEQKYMQACSVGVLMLIQLLYAFRQDTLIGALNRVQDIDDRLLKISGYRVKNGISAYVLFFLNIVLGAGLLVAKDIELGNKPFFQFFMTVFPSVFINWMAVQYIMVLNVLLKRFKQLYHVIIKIDKGEISIGRSTRLLVKEQSFEEAPIDRKIELLSELLDDLDDIRMDVLWFFSPPLTVGGLDLGGTAAVMAYDIDRAVNEKSVLKPMEIAMYVLWFSMAFLVILAMVIYYAANKFLEWWIRCCLKRMLGLHKRAADARSKLQKNSSIQPQQLVKNEEDSILVDLSIP